MAEIQRTQYIKVNFPDSQQKYIAGNGEGMWVLVDDADAIRAILVPAPTPKPAVLKKGDAQV